jgi:hypothetical protein
MSNAKRASMREGPLSQLFRKTAEDAADGDTAGPQSQRRIEAPAARPELPAAG